MSAANTVFNSLISAFRLCISDCFFPLEAWHELCTLIGLVFPWKLHIRLLCRFHTVVQGMLGGWLSSLLIAVGLTSDQHLLQL